jgi:hypothetical protein
MFLSTLLEHPTTGKPWEVLTEADNPGGKAEAAIAYGWDHREQR